jgi:hypothetical protein
MSNRRNLIIILIVLWGLLVSGLSIYLWRVNQRLEARNQLLFRGIKDSRDFAKNSNDSYRMLGECVADYSKCDPNETKSKLLKLRDEKDKIWSRLQELDQQLQIK